MKLTFAKQLLTLLLTFVITQSFVYAEYLQNANPPAKEFDWMELKSGEWLKGEFKGLYSGDIEFDSDEFDLVTFDTDDVKQMITKGNSIVSLNRNMPSALNLYKAAHENEESGALETVGNIKFADNTFTLTMEDGSSRVLPTTDIASILGGEPKESNYWSASAFLGVDTLSGNSNQVTITAKAAAVRRTALTRFSADYLATYTNVEDKDTNETVTTANSNRFSSSFDLYQTAHIYWRLASLEYLRDPFQNIDGRYTIAVGIGYDIIYTPKTNWSLTAGPGYQRTYYTDYNETDPDSTQYAETPLVFLDSHFDTELTNDIDFIIDYTAYFVNLESGQYIHHAMVAIESEIISDLTIDFSLFWDRTSEPIAFSDGTVPEKNDYKTMLAVGYSY